MSYLTQQVMHLKLALLILAATLLAVDSAAIESSGRNITENRDPKFMSLFSVVRFPNEFCYGTNNYNGTCLTSAECSASGGTGAGSCASGFGVCCTAIVSSCGSTATMNNTYWQNPGFSTAYTNSGQCSITVKKSDEICQLRLDFISFAIAGPDSSTAITQCLTDTFTVSGAFNNVPVICGTNTNQHRIPTGTNTVSLSMLLTGTVTDRYWNILIAHIPCGTSYTAPDDCLQWFTTTTGTLSSFNFLFSTDPAVQKLAFQDYAICIRANAGYCGVGFSVCTGVPIGTPVFSMGPATSAGRSDVDATCTEDWILIPCATDQQSTSIMQSDGKTACVSKICGFFFDSVAAGKANIPVYSYRKPFEVRVYTDISDVDTTYSGGFCLSYIQQPCIASSG